MDMFNIGLELLEAMDDYYNSARGTGRTTYLLNKVKNDDVVIFVDLMQANYFEKLAKSKGIDVVCRVIDSNDYPSVEFQNKLRSIRSKGNTYFDHVWFEKFYKQSMIDAIKQIEYMQIDLSNYDN